MGGQHNELRSPLQLMRASPRDDARMDLAGTTGDVHDGKLDPFLAAMNQMSVSRM